MKNQKIIILIGISILHSLHASVAPWREKVVYATENYADDANVVIQGARSSGQPGMRDEVEIQFINDCPNCLPEVAIQSIEEPEQQAEEKVTEDKDEKESDDQA